MKRAFIVTAAAFLLGVVVGPAVAARPLKGLSASDLGLGMPKKETPFEPGWSAGAGVLFFHRSTSAPLVLAETPPPESMSLVDSSDIGLGFEAGPIIFLARQITETTAAEIVYFGIDGWGGSASAVLPGGIATSRFDIGPTLLDQVDVTYRTRINNVEVNAQHNISPRFRWLIGFRWAGLEESSQLLWEGRQTGTDFCSMSSGASNNLYGIQFGLAGTLWQPSARLHLDGSLKAGVLANHMSTNREVAGTFSTVSSESRTVDRTSFLGECGLLGTLDFTERISLSAGYQVMWLDGVATAFSPLSPQDVDSLFYHGPRLLLEAKW